MRVALFVAALLQPALALAQPSSPPALVRSVAGRTGAISLSVGDVAGAETTANRGANGGYAYLDSTALVPLAELHTQTADALATAAALSSTDQVLLRQSGTSVLLGSLANLQTYVLGGLSSYLQPVVTVSAPATLNAAHGGAIVAVGAAGTVSFDAAATADGWHTDIANTAAGGTVTLAAINGGIIAANGGLSSLLPGRAVHVIRYTVAGIPTFQIIGGTPAPQLSLNTVAGVLTGNAVTVSGNYVNTTITSLQYQVDSGAWSAASGASIGGGSFSFTVAGIGTGTHTIGVRDAANTATFATSGAFAVAASNQITVNTPAGVLANQSATISGSYVGTPAAIQVAFDSPSGWATLASAPAGGVYGGTVAAPAVGTHTVYTRFADGSVTSSASGAFTVTGVPTITAATPANVAHLGTLAMSGTYAYDMPTGIQYSLDGTSWFNAPSPAIAGGAWSFSLAGLPDAYYAVQVRLTDSPAAAATAGPAAVGTAIYCTIPTTTPVAGSALAVNCQSTITGHAIRWSFQGQTVSSPQPQVSYNSSSSSAGVTWPAGSIQVPASPGTYVIQPSDGSAVVFTLPAITATAAPAPAISIVPWGYNQAAAGFTVTGYWGNTAPSAIDYSLNGGTSWLTNGASTINANGTWSLTIPANTAGSYSNFEIRRRDAPLVTTPAGGNINLQ